MSLVSGGETIRQLQVQSGAHIELHRGAHPNPAEKLFNIRGINNFSYAWCCYPRVGRKVGYWSCSWWWMFLNLQGLQQLIIYMYLISYHTNLTTSLVSPSHLPHILQATWSFNVFRRIVVGWSDSGRAWASPEYTRNRKRCILYYIQRKLFFRWSFLIGSEKRSNFAQNT